MNSAKSQLVPERPAVLSDIEVLRARARQHIESGAVTNGYAADRKAVLDLLNGALATELVCVLRYKRHYFMAKGISSEAVKTEFLAHANEEMVHADLLAKRICELGGEPDFSPDGLSARSHAEYVVGDTLEEMIKEDLVAERIAIDSSSTKAPSSRSIVATASSARPCGGARSRRGGRQSVSLGGDAFRGARKHEDQVKGRIPSSFA